MFSCEQDVGETIIDRIDRPGRRASTWRFPHIDTAWPLERLREHATSFSGALVARGVEPGDRVALSSSAGPDCVALLLGLWCIGAVAVPLRPQAGKGLGYAQYLAEVDAICSLKLAVVDAADGDPVDPGAVACKVLSTNRLLSGKATRSPAPVRIATEGDTAVLQMTSGSTNRPRAVVVTHRMIMEQLAYLSDSAQYYSGHAVRSAASWLPINHDMGLFTGLLWPLYDGADNLLASPAFYMRDPARWFRLLSERRVDMNFATNTSAAAACRTLPRRLEPGSVDLSDLQLYFGAEKLQVSVLERVEHTFASYGLDPERIHVGYGMAENALAATRSPRGTVRRVAAAIDAAGEVTIAKASEQREHQVFTSVGAPFEGYSLQIRDPATGTSLPERRLGEVCLSGPCLTPGYFADPQATAAALREGALHSGDLGFMHQGELYYVGRRDDLVNLGGRKLVPDDVEHVVEALPFVGTGRSCFLGLTEEAGVTMPLLLIETGNRQSSEQERQHLGDVRRALLDGLDLHIGRILFCAKGTVEKTSSGKKRRRVIRKRYLEGNIRRIGRAPGVASVP